MVALVRELHGQRQSLRQISKTLAAQDHLTGGAGGGRPNTATYLANLPLARMPLFDSQRGVDAPWLFEAGTLAGVRSQRMPPRFVSHRRAFAGRPSAVRFAASSAQAPGDARRAQDRGEVRGQAWHADGAASAALQPGG